MKRVLLLVLLLFISGCVECKEVVINTDSGEHVFSVEIADNDRERAKGLMYREEMNLDKGMLFVYEDEEIRSFWMKNTLIPLDIIFIDSDLSVVDIKEDVLPCEEVCEGYMSLKPAKYVLEINAGLSKEMGLDIGANIELKV
ncbi:DUF192 domain-containing protein [Nanoarchaeota archaeon]